MSLVFLGLLSGPVAWALAMTLSYGLSSYACFPDGERLTVALPGWGGALAVVPIVHVVALAVTLAGAAISYRAWSVTRTEAAGHALEIGEGRTRFMGAWGLMTCALFLGLLIFNLINVAMVPPCAT